MSTRLHTAIRRTGLVLLVVSGLAAIGASSSLAGYRPPASFYTKQQIQTMSDSWAARGGVLTNVPSSSYYTPPQIQTLSDSWAARGGVLTNVPSSSYYTPQQIQRMSQSWAARGGVFANRQVTHSAGSTAFDWGDFGIGAAAMLGLVLLATGLLAGVHFSRKIGVRPRPIS